jgi:glycosyltransferase involved in cell wall biosynthesis
MRVLYDVSTLGLAHLYRESRGGSYRADLHITEGLAASGECGLRFCANHSTVAYHGCEAFLAGHAPLRDVPLIAPANTAVPRALRRATSGLHRGARAFFGSHVLPSFVRRCATFVDRRLHPPAADSGVDIFHSPSVPLPPRSGPRSPQRFLTLYDLAYLRFPDLYCAAYRRSAMAAIHSVGDNDCIMTASTFTRDELCERRIATPERIHVVPLAADPAIFHPCADSEAVAAVRGRYGIPEGPYVLSVSSPDPRKDVAKAIHAFGRAAREGRDVLASLVLAGDGHHGSDQIESAIAAYPEMRNRVVVTGYVPDADLSPLYTGARVFVYPSIYEGFGLPPLEAMQCGTPVITSMASSLPEVVGDGGLMVPAHDVDEFAAAMLALARDGALHDRMRARALARAGRFNWSTSIDATLRAYRAALLGGVVASVHPV